MLLHACGGFPGASRPSRWPPGASRGLQGPGGSRTLRATKSQNKHGFERKMRPRLKFRAGWSGWTRPPTRAGGGFLRDLNALRLDASADSDPAYPPQLTYLLSLPDRPSRESWG